MTLVEGQIESLKQIKAELNQNGISRFHSVGDMKEFIKTYETERQDIFNQAEHHLNLQIEELQQQYSRHKEFHARLKNEFTSKLTDLIEKSQAKEASSVTKSTDNLVIKAIHLVQLLFYRLKVAFLRRNFENIICLRTSISQLKVYRTGKTLDKYLNNKEKILIKRCAPKFKELAFIKETVERLDPLIAGAIGESLVEKELKKLSDEYILFNDFSVDFRTPIINKKENDKIFSIQIDHLLVSNSGIFILETKNWSKKSIESYDLRSPVTQIRRTGFALFVLLNSDTKHQRIDLKGHHWGSVQIPIRNVVVMINDKPKERFKYVSVKTLSELNYFITHFDPIFEDSEVESIAAYLRGLQK